MNYKSADQASIKNQSRFLFGKGTMESGRPPHTIWKGYDGTWKTPAHYLERIRWDIGATHADMKTQQAFANRQWHGKSDTRSPIIKQKSRMVNAKKNC